MVIVAWGEDKGDGGRGNHEWLRRKVIARGGIFFWKRDMGECNRMGGEEAYPVRIHSILVTLKVCPSYFFVVRALRPYSSSMSHTKELNSSATYSEMLGGKGGPRSSGMV